MKAIVTVTGALFIAILLDAGVSVTMRVALSARGCLSLFVPVVVGGGSDDVLLTGVKVNDMI